MGWGENAPSSIWQTGMPVVVVMTPPSLPPPLPPPPAGGPVDVDVSTAALLYGEFVRGTYGELDVVVGVDSDVIAGRVEGLRVVVVVRAEADEAAAGGRQHGAQRGRGGDGGSLHVVDATGGSAPGHRDNVPNPASG